MLQTARSSYHHGNLGSALVEAGLELTRTGGPEALVLRDATRRAGVSPSAAYRHFADRESLLAAVAHSIQDGMVERMRSFESTGDARDRLRAVGLGYIAFALREPGWFQVAFSATDALPDEAGALPAPLELLSSTLDDLVADGSLAAADRPGAEWPCWSSVHGFALLALHGPLRALPSERVWASAERTVDAVITGLLA